MMREGEGTRCSSGRIWTRRVCTEPDAHSAQRWPVPWRVMNHVRISLHTLEIRSPCSHFCACHATVVEAVNFAAMYTHHGIATAFPMGSGHGPLNHMHPLLP